MEPPFDYLFKISFFLMLVCWAVGFFKTFSFYRSWRRDRSKDLGPIFLEFSSPTALFSSNLSAETRSIRRQLLLAWGLFLLFLAMGLILLLRRN